MAWNEFELNKYDPVEDADETFNIDLALNDNWDAIKARDTELRGKIDAKAPLVSPALTGTPTAPTPAFGNSTTRIATTAFVDASLASFVDGAPEALNTLNELAAALGNDPNFATTVLNQIGAITQVRTATITTTWTGTSAPYTQTVSVTGVTADDEPVISPVYSATNATAILEKAAWNLVGKIETGANAIFVTCFEEKPTQAINIQIKGV